MNILRLWSDHAFGPVWVLFVAMQVPRRESRKVRTQLHHGGLIPAACPTPKAAFAWVGISLRCHSAGLMPRRTLATILGSRSFCLPTRPEPASERVFSAIIAVSS
jgi:hypothetical protein